MSDEHWFQIELSGVYGDRLNDRTFLRSFLDLQLRPECPKHLCFFESVSDNYSPKSTIYLPPVASPYMQQLLDQFHAVPCDKPDRHSVTGDAGSESDFAYWFEGTNKA